MLSFYRNYPILPQPLAKDEMQALVLQIPLVRHAILIENVVDIPAAVHTSGMLENHTLLNDFKELRHRCG